MRGSCCRIIAPVVIVMTFSHEDGLPSGKVRERNKESVTIVH